MKILLVITKAEIGGAQAFVLNLARGLKKRGNDVVVAAGEGDFLNEELKKEATIAGYRSSIGRGMRSEKIRTYNFPQNRLTDHRLNHSWHNLENIVDGNLDNVLEEVNKSLI